MSHKMLSYLYNRFNLSWSYELISLYKQWRQNLFNVIYMNIQTHSSTWQGEYCLVTEVLFKHHRRVLYIPYVSIRRNYIIWNFWRISLQVSVRGRRGLTVELTTANQRESSSDPGLKYVGRPVSILLYYPTLLGTWLTVGKRLTLLKCFYLPHASCARTEKDEISVD